MKSTKKILLNAILSFIILTLLNSCHKYSEDSSTSWKRPWKRIEGAWKFTSYKINGAEHSHDFDNLLSPKTLTDCSITFAAFNNIDGWYIIKDNSGKVVFPVSYLSTQYEFNNNYENLVIVGANTGPDTIFYKPFWKISNTEKWRIKELDSKKIHLNNYNNVDIYLSK